MKPKMRRNLPGPFLARDLGADTWRLSRPEPGPVEVFVLGASPEAAQLFRAQPLRDIDIEWGVDCAWLKSSPDGVPKTVQMRGVAVHEPLPRLYSALPLAGPDERARRFWRWVFRLVRIPGGRHLLGFLTRRSRGGH